MSKMKVTTIDATIDIRDLISVNEAARIYKTTPQGIYQMVRKRRLKPVIRKSRFVLFRRADVKRLRRTVRLGRPRKDAKTRAA